MKDMIFDEFQYQTDELLVRNKSILDQMTKLTDAGARVNRAVVKAATDCGCISIHARQQEYDESLSMEEQKKKLDTHIRGKLCNSCREQLEKELGKNLFYMTTLCNTLGLNLYDIVLKELEGLKTLGKYNLR